MENTLKEHRIEGLMSVEAMDTTEMFVYKVQVFLLTKRRRSRLVLAQFRNLRAGSGTGMQTRKWVRNAGFTRRAVLGVECSRGERKERNRRKRNAMIVPVNARSQELSRVDLLQKIKRELAVQSLYSLILSKRVEKRKGIIDT